MFALAAHAVLVPKTSGYRQGIFVLYVLLHDADAVRRRQTALKFPFEFVMLFYMKAMDIL